MSKDDIIDSLEEQVSHWKDLEDKAQITIIKQQQLINRMIQDANENQKLQSKR